MNADRPIEILARLLSHPEGVSGLSGSDWTLVVAVARRSGLLARLAFRVDERSLMDRIPEPVRDHLEAEQLVAERHRRDVISEIHHLGIALKGVVSPLVLLKGAAYAMAELPPARGRTFTDIDILVPRPSLDTVERALRQAGWTTGEIHPYDELYYRRWMHQLPPLTHAHRGTTVDVHHTIVPTTARTPISATPLLDAARTLSGAPGLAVLQPVDMVLHSAVHLFSEGQFDRALRDLDDIASLLRHFGSDALFWPLLVSRTEQLRLQRPAWYAFEFCRVLFDVVVPSGLSNSIHPMAPPRVIRALMLSMLESAMEPTLRSSSRAGQRWANDVLYVRSHYLRMPIRQLLPHLIRKAVRREPRDEAAMPRRI
jgi:hypothetical protein